MILERHPWTMDILAVGPPRTLSQLAWLDRGLKALSPTSLDEREKAAVMLLLNGHVFWQARIATAAAGTPPGGGRATNPHDVLTRLVDADELPALRRAIDSGIFEDQSTGPDLAFGLDRVLDGVELLVDRRERTTSRSRAPVVDT